MPNAKENGKPNGSSCCAPQAVEDSVQSYYGKQLKTSKDLKTSACTAAGRPHAEVRKLIQRLPSEVVDKFYGCGAPLPLGVDGCVAGHQARCL